MPSPVRFHDPAQPQGRRALLAALREGRVLALPTETVPGLAVLADRPDGSRRLSELKRAPAEQPHTLHLRHLDDLCALLPAPPPGLGPWLLRRMPGPFTLVVPRSWTALPRDWAWSWNTVGLRLPQHPAYQELASLLHVPLLMTSINPHGTPPLRGEALAAWFAQHPDVEVGFDPFTQPVGTASTVLEFDPLPQLRRGSLAGPDRLPGLRVLVLCSGNICRSPLAAALLERELASAWGVKPADLHRLGWVVASAGTFAVPGVEASAQTVQAGREVGLDLRGHRAQHLEDALRQPWDLVLGMGENHLRPLPGGVHVDLFDPARREVPDPFGADLPTYREVRDQVTAAAEARVAGWCGWPGR